MKIVFDSSRYDFFDPRSTILKKLVMISMLQSPSKKMNLSRLATYFDNSEKQIKRDLRALSKFYEINYDIVGKPYISNCSVLEDSLGSDLLSKYIKMINLLRDGNGYTFKELSAELNISERNIYNYFNNLDKILDIDSDWDGKYFLVPDYNQAA